MSILFIIPYHYLDSVLWLRYTINQLKAHGDIIVITDEVSPPIEMIKPAKQIWIEGFGVGKARNKGILYGLKEGYDCFIFSDSHMVIPENIEELCKHKMSQPAIVAVDVVKGGLRNIGSPVLGDFLGEYDWRWYYILRSESKKSIMSTQPMVQFSRDVIETLVSANNGYFTQCWYWGKELHDPTLSATRLGFDMDLVDTVIVGHVYKEGSIKGWVKRFALRKIGEKEPWANYIVTNSPYMFSIDYGNCIFAFKHYTEEEIKLLRINKEVCEVAKKDDKIMMSLKEFNKNARYTRHDVYLKLNEYLVGADFVLVQ